MENESKVEKDLFSLPVKTATELSVSDIIKLLNTNADQGLVEGEVDKRRKICGLNEFCHDNSVPLWRTYLDQVLTITLEAMSNRELVIVLMEYQISFKS